LDQLDLFDDLPTINRNEVLEKRRNAERIRWVIHQLGDRSDG
jgi:hypothetical protein